MLRTVIALVASLVVAAVAGAQYHNGYTSDGYVYRDGYFWSGAQAYTRYLVQSPGYWKNHCYYYGASYYAYTPYYAPQTYTAPAANDDYKAALLKIAAEREKHQQFMEAVKAMKLDGPGGYYPTPPGYGYQGHYYQYTPPVNATTQYGYSYRDISQMYGTADIGLLYQQAAQLAQGAQRLTGDATLGFQQLVSQAGSDKAKVAEILAKGQVAAEVIRALSSSSAGEFKGYSFKIMPGGQVEKIEDNVNPALKQQLQAKLADLVSAKCASCHTGAKPKGGFDISTYLQLTQDQKQAVWSLLTTTDANKMMPRAADGGPGKKLTQEEIRLFFLN